MFHFFHTFHPQSVLFHLGPLSIHWYGLLMVVGGLLGFYVVLKLADKFKIERKIFEDLLIFWVVGAILGARLYYVIYAWEFYKDNLIEIFKIWQGGLAIHGIMIGGFAAMLIFCLIRKVNFWQIADLAVVGLVLGQAIGRNGNYFNQEIFGKPTSLPWGIPIDVVNRPDNYLSSDFFHPTFLYEVFGNIIILGVLLLLTKQRLKTGKWQVGNVLLIYLSLYSILRFCLEFLRVDYSPLVFGVRWPQIMSVLILIGSLVVLFYRNFRQKSIAVLTK